MSLLISCSDEKETEACYECILTARTTGSGVSNSATSKVNQCGLTESEAKQMETSGTNTITSSSGGISVTITNTTKCTKK